MKNLESKRMANMDFYKKLDTFVENNDFLSLQGLITSHPSKTRDEAKNEKKQSLMNKAAKIGNFKIANLLLKYGFEFNNKKV